MPSNYIKKLHKDGKGSLAKLEKAYKQAGAIAEGEGHGGDYAYITTIFKSLIGIKSSVTVDAAFRLIAEAKQISDSESENGEEMNDEELKLFVDKLISKIGDIVSSGSFKK